MRAMLQRVLLATFSIHSHHAISEAFSPPFPHFDPFGTEFREPGLESYPNCCRLNSSKTKNTGLLQRSF
jgi:hypothetical protein